MRHRSPKLVHSEKWPMFSSQKCGHGAKIPINFYVKGRLHVEKNISNIRLLYFYLINRI